MALYGVTALVIAAGATAEALVAGRVRHAIIEGVAAVGAFVMMALWVRANRVSLDLADWCDCAGEMIVVRVVSSRPRPHETFSLPMAVEERDNEAAETVISTVSDASISVSF